MFEIRPIFATIVASTLSAMVVSATVSAADANAPVAGAGKAAAAKTAAVVAEPDVPKLTASAIVERHVAARGGAQAWKTVQTLQLAGRIEAGRGDNIARAKKMSYAGKKAGGRGTNVEVATANVETGSTKQIQLPFTLDLKRPNLTRLEIEFDGKTAVQVFDGEHGWKYRPFLNRKDVEPFSPDEAKSEAAHDGLDGPLVEYSAKGTSVELEGADMVESQPAYRLKVTLKSGFEKHVWIDAKTFLDVKVEGVPKRMDGAMHSVYVYQRDFRPVQGVMIPFVQETAVEGYSETHKLQVEKAAVNPVFDDTLFSKPHA